MKEAKIICPNCGREYLPSEIYIPDAFFGRPKGIERDVTNGRIIDYYGTPMDVVEHFECEGCGVPFKIVAKVSFATTEESDINFDKPYVSNLKEAQLFMKED